jgi:hypothetical protein
MYIEKLCVINITVKVQQCIFTHIHLFSKMRKMKLASTTETGLFV